MKSNGKSNLMSFIERMFSKKKTSQTKKYLILFSIIGFIISLVLSISLPLLLKPLNESQIYYKFEDKYFSSKEDIYNYSSSRSINNNYSFETNKYIFDDKVFNTKDDLNDYIENKFQIKSINTKRNPNDYLINASGELSSLVKTSEYEKNQKIYKGLNGSVYFSEEDAKQTFINSYSLNYSIDGQIFDNIYNAKNYYLDIKLKDLEENGTKTMCYEQSGMCQSKEHITSWIRNNIVKGFEYQGQHFSDLNYIEFLETMKELDNDTINKHVRPVINGDRSSYWVTQNSNKALGYFIGPKYFESNELISSVAHFEPIKSYDVNGVILNFTMSAGFVIISEILDSKIEHTNTTEYEMMNYLTTIFNDLNLNENLLEIYNNDFYKYLSPNLKEDLSFGLGEINDPELTDFYRLLISFKRFLDLTTIYEIPNISSQDLEKILKEIIVEILNSEKQLMNNIFDIDEKGNGANILLDESISFDDIYSLFLNTESFFNDGGQKAKIWNIAQRTLDFLDKVMDSLSAVSGNIDKVNGNINKLQKSSNRTDSYYRENVEQNYNLLVDGLSENTEVFYEALGVELNSLKVRNPLAIIGIVAGAWNLGKMISFTTLKTYEAKLDSNQSLYYFEPTFKIPFTNISFGNKVSDQPIHILNEAPLNYFSPKLDGQELKQIYEFNGKYYKERTKAIEDLKYEIYKKPEEYLITKEIFSSVLENDNGYKINLPKICSSNKDDNEECISAYEYEIRLAKEKEKYVQQLFNTHYKNSGKEYFIDGFGGAWDTKDAAISAIKQKADNISNYQQVYSYWLNNKKVVKDTKEEIQEFIQQNQVVESKTVINTDLISTSYYDNLKENHGYDFEIYQMNFYGQQKYFRTYLEALNYLDKKINYEVYSYNRNEKTYTYSGVEFINQQQFEHWIDSQIKVVSEQEFLNQGGEIWNDKTRFNSPFYW